VRKNFSAPPVAGEVFFLGIPLYRTRLPEKSFLVLQFSGSMPTGHRFSIRSKMNSTSSIAFPLPLGKTDSILNHQ